MKYSKEEIKERLDFNPIFNSQTPNSIIMDLILDYAFIKFSENNEEFPKIVDLLEENKILQARVGNLANVILNLEKKIAELNLYEQLRYKLSDKMKNILFIRLSDLQTTVRTRKCLQNIFLWDPDTYSFDKNRRAYIGDLVVRTESEMIKTPNFGRKSLNELKQILESKGLRFGLNIPEWEELKRNDNNLD